MMKHVSQELATPLFSQHLSPTKQANPDEDKHFLK